MREINLLPPERRKRLRNESMAVSLTAFVSGVNAGLLIMTVSGAAMIGLLLFFSFTVARTTEQELEDVLEDYQQLRDVVSEKNAVLGQVASLGQDRIVWTEVLQELFKVVPSGVTINQLGAGVTLAEGATSASLQFDGRAATRSTLTIFEDRLRALDFVTEVQSPTSNLLERNNPAYQFSVILRQAMSETDGDVDVEEIDL